MPHEAHRVVAMIVGQDKDDVARLGAGHALDVQLVGGSRLAKRSQAKRHGKKNSDAHNGKWETAATCSLAGECGVAAWPCKAGPPLFDVESPVLHSAPDSQESGRRSAGANHRLDGLPVFEVGRFLQQKLVAVSALPLDLHRAVDAGQLAADFASTAAADIYRVAAGFLFDQARGQRDVQFIVVRADKNFLELVDVEILRASFFGVCADRQVIAHARFALGREMNVEQRVCRGTEVEVLELHLIHQRRRHIGKQRIVLVQPGVHVDAEHLLLRQREGQVHIALERPRLQLGQADNKKGGKQNQSHIHQSHKR